MEVVLDVCFSRFQLSFHNLVQILENLNAVMRGDNAYKTYRETLARSAPPCIPYLYVFCFAFILLNNMELKLSLSISFRGVHLSDLTFIEDGNPDTIDGLINFTKRRLVFRVISDLVRYLNQID